MAEVAAMEWKPVEGGFVEIVEMGDEQVMTFAVREKDRKYVNVDGQYAYVLGWLAGECRWQVRTFSGYVVAIPDKNLREYVPPSTEEGGFDLGWSVDEDMDGFGEAVATCLARKGYCVVQMYVPSKLRREAADVAGDFPDLQDQLRQELESAYLGSGTQTRVTVLPPDEPDADIEDALSLLRRQLTNAFLALTPFTPDFLGYEVWSWTSPWARMVGDGDIEPSRALTDMDVLRGHVASYERFMTGRKTCALYMVQNSGGEIQLFPRHGSDMAQAGIGEVTLPIAKNRLLLFRHDAMSFAYCPKGHSLALQSWLLSDIEVARINKTVKPLTGVSAPPPGENAQVMSVYQRKPGAVDGNEQFWAMMASGTDTDQEWPKTRWDVEQYYTQGDDYMMVFKSYTKHGAFMTQTAIEQFDCEFFQISNAEAKGMCPGQRLVLEVGYTCLRKAGHSATTLRGENVGVFLGDVGIDWHSAAPWWSYKAPQDVTQEQCNYGMHVGVTCSRLSHFLDLVGPVQTVDTACSASLVALQAGHKQMLHYAQDPNKAGSCTAPHSILSGGVNTLVDPGSYVGNCMANMLSHVGRCWTFDRTADGYQRGEGCGMMFIKWSGDVMDMDERLCCLVGSCANHDGRSASLTAPNGPSQQDCIRRSMRMAGVDPSKISVAECHGTGTALGDPIEVGALQGVMRGLRTFPIINTSAKTNISHLEAAAGSAGIIKCVMMIVHAAGPPNVHLRSLNAHLIVDGYPVYFQQELCECSFTTNCLGVSSFGFGGTNSRADVYGRCLHGSKFTGNVWTPERVEARNLAYLHGMRGMYKGRAHFVPSEIKSHQLYLVGTWDGWDSLTKMECTSPGCYTCTVPIAETRKESFKIVVDGDLNRRLFPSVQGAESNALIMGPSQMDNSRAWTIDGARFGVTSGAVFRIHFEWVGERKAISWELEPDATIPMAPRKEHGYHIVGTWNRWQPQEMQLVSQEDGLYELTFSLAGPEGLFQSAEFQFLRDADWMQIIHPTAHRTNWVGDQVCGPDSEGHLKTWLVDLVTNEECKVQLQVLNGNVRVHAATASGRSVQWASVTESLFYVTGSFNQWGHSLMSKDQHLAGLYRYHLRVDEGSVQEFRIMVDVDRTNKLKSLAEALQGDDVEEEVFEFEPAGDSFWEVVLDLNQDDKHRMVYWRLATAREHHLVPIAS